MLDFRLNPLLFWSSCICHCLHDFFDSVVRFGSCLTLAAWKIHGSLGLRSLHSLDWALLRCRPSPSCLAHVPFFPMSVGLADDPAMPLHCSYYDHFSFISLLPLGLQAEAPTSPFSTFFLLLGFTGQHFCWANPLSTSLPLLGFIGPHSCCASPFHSLGFLGPFHSSGFLGPFSSSLPLLLVWAFAAQLPHPCLLLPFGLIGLYADPMNLLLHFLGFPNPFTSSLPLIIPTSLLLHFLGFFGLFASSLPLIIFLWAYRPLFLPFRLSGLYFIIFSSHFLHIVGLLLPLGLLSKVGINKSFNGGNEKFIPLFGSLSGRE